MFMGKSTLSEQHSNFIDVYNGHILAEDICEVAENSDLVISFGTIRSDINTGAFTVQINPVREISIHPDHVHIGHEVISLGTPQGARPGRNYP
ncbi:MAG: hypothetical protein BA863_15150 [Desulfovibrio sp. S3730MH75]|nr:MAG: hypothetical protein BA863_15150 [Desulfovibrio sp. S3730MH75]